MKPGSRQWASSKPNLLKVAVSRAKCRLHMIDSIKNWSPWPYKPPVPWRTRRKASHSASTGMADMVNSNWWSALADDFRLLARDQLSGQSIETSQLV
jgi:hypothetical protein